MFEMFVLLSTCHQPPTHASTATKFIVRSCLCLTPHVSSLVHAYIPKCSSFSNESAFDKSSSKLVRAPALFFGSIFLTDSFFISLEANEKFSKNILKFIISCDAFFQFSLDNREFPAVGRPLQ